MALGMVSHSHTAGFVRPRSDGRMQRASKLGPGAVWATASTPPKPSTGVSSSTLQAGRSPSLATQLRFAMPSKGEEAGPSSVQQLATGFRPLSRVAYQGAPGAYSEMAALKALPNWEPMPCEQFEVAFQALSQWLAERAVLPVENSLGGSIHDVYDLLLRYRLHIVGEVSIVVNHCLLALPGVSKTDIKRVMSHPQALAQTDGYTRKLGVVREAVDDTAGAAKLISEKGWRDVAAVASRRAGELYGLSVLEDGIQDQCDNVTRFIVLSRDPQVAAQPNDTRPYKTSIVFTLHAGPGMLFKALSVFALRDIDLTKIESRPMRENPLVLSMDYDDSSMRTFNYMFYIDFVGSLAEPKVQNALRHMEEISPFLRILGSYPRDVDL
ncbi:ADT1 [Auxenochlorella protothecoides x Auxenochlorella symbiontica]